MGQGGHRMGVGWRITDERNLVTTKQSEEREREMVIKTGIPAKGHVGKHSIKDIVTSIELCTMLASKNYPFLSIHWS